MDMECYFDNINKKIDEMSDSEFIDLLNKSGLEKCPYLENEVKTEILEIRKGKGNKKVATIKLEVGTKIEVKGEVLKALQENPYVNKTFKLNILKIDNDWYSVYFEDINKYYTCKNCSLEFPIDILNSYKNKCPRCYKECEF